MNKHFLRANKMLLYAIALSAFSILVLMVRIAYSQQFDFAFLASNLFLAWVPFAISFALHHSTQQTHFLIKFFLFILWILFLPNSAYIITDIIHLDKYETMPQWFDLLMLVLFSWSGIIWGLFSLQIVQTRILRKKNNRIKALFNITLFFLCGIGIYLGRYQRWNSWDVIFNLRKLLLEIYTLFSNTQSISYMLGMGVLYCILLSFIYFPFQRSFQVLSINKKKYNE